MLRAYPQSWFSWKFRILNDSDRQIATIDIGWVRESGELKLGEKIYRLYREGLLGGAFILEYGGRELARAEKPSAFLRSFSVSYRGRQFTLQAASPVTREFRLIENNGPIGTVRPENAFMRKAVIDLPGTIELPVQIFLAWLVLVLWKRNQESSS
jgi:hypothetical protein